jgi:regulator of PEP synthase PpsR (kinase-PPPase family)
VSLDKVFIVSDGTGRTAEQALNAALTQFEDTDLRMHRCPDTRSEEAVKAIVEEAARSGGFIVHTFVTDRLRHVMVRSARERNVEAIDIMGTLLARLSHRFAVSPAEKPGLFGQLNEQYFRRIETMEFAINHDDGLRVHEVHKAELVLIGVSRTFKTPLSIYLAFKGWFVANIPVVMSMDLPPLIDSLPPEKVFCLDTLPHHLTELRRARDEYLGETGNYADLEAVRQELMWARSLFRKRPMWSVVYVTNKPIEEIASEILALKTEALRRGADAPF